MTPDYTMKADGKPASKGYCGPRYILERWQKGECESRSDGIRDYVYYSIMQAKRYGRGYHEPTHSIARLFECSQQSVRRAVKSSNVITRKNNAWILLKDIKVEKEGKVSGTPTVPELDKGEGLVGPIPRGIVCPQKGPTMPSISNSTGGLLGPINSSKPLNCKPLAEPYTPIPPVLLQTTLPEDSRNGCPSEGGLKKSGGKQERGSEDRQPASIMACLEGKPNDNLDGIPDDILDAPLDAGPTDVPPSMAIPPPR